MTFQQPAIFLLLCCALILMSAPLVRRRMALWFLAINAAFLVLQFLGATLSLILIVAEVVLHYLVLLCMLRLKQRSGRVILYWAWLASTLVAFAIVKKYFWVTDAFVGRAVLPQGLQAVGCSFLLFRQICLTVTVRDGMATSIRAIDYVNYCLAFWTFLAGPVQRFESFVEEFSRMSAPDRVVPGRDVLLGLNRAMLGFMKMFILDRFLERWATPVPTVLRPDRMHVALAVLALPVHVYVNFSGYCDIVIGLARAVGFTLPENFRHPYLARNSLDFWRRWHVTLSEFFRDYLYFPLFVVMSRKLPSLFSMVVATIFSFIVMGAWHGNTFRFVVFGIVHGIGVAVATLYQQFLKKALTKEGLKRYQESPWIHGLAVVSFQCFVILSFIPFQYEMRDLVRLGRLVLQPGRLG